jgi:hypothetical protein
MACGLGHLEDEVEYEDPQNDADEDEEKSDRFNRAVDAKHSAMRRPTASLDDCMVPEASSQTNVISQ